MIDYDQVGISVMIGDWDRRHSYTATHIPHFPHSSQNLCREHSSPQTTHKRSEAHYQLSGAIKIQLKASKAEYAEDQWRTLVIIIFVTLLNCPEYVLSIIICIKS